MALVPISISNRSNPARYKQGGSAQLINCYVEKIGEEGKTSWAIYASDGLQGLAVLPSVNGGFRKGLDVEGIYYAVAGTRFYSITAAGVVTLISSMNIDATAPVYIERNRRASPDIAIVCAGLMYYYRAGVFTQVTDVDLLAPTSLAFVDGYFVIGTANNQFQSGDIDDASSWQPLSYSRADANPDAVVRIGALQQDVYVFGQKSTEVWRDTGAATFPFTRVTSMDIGLLAADSVVNIEQTIAFVAYDRTVRMFNGYSATRISEHAQERAIEALADRSTIKGSTWVRGGHSFYCISSSDWTWVYDTTTLKWHERKSYARNNWKISYVSTFGAKIIAGDIDTGTLYEMSDVFMDEAGQPLISTIVLPPVHAFPARLTFNQFYIDVQRGVGTGQGAVQDIAPFLMFDWSDDGGATYKAQRMLSLGEQGKVMTRVRTTRMGQSDENGRVFRFSVSAKVARAFYAAHADVTKDAA